MVSKSKFWHVQEICCYLLLTSQTSICQYSNSCAYFTHILSLKESHGRAISSITKMDENLSASQLNVIALEKSLSAAGEKYIFMQKLRDFVSVICEFLQVCRNLILFFVLRAPISMFIGL